MAISDLIGSSPVFRELIDNVAMVAPLDSAVLTQGETGTGNEVIARAIHEASPRRSQRFVALNCAAIPCALLESELLGHEKAAFTGAVAQAIGRFHAANGGTLFLDEIGDLPVELQPKLLRALQEKQFERMGSVHTHQVDVRVIAATHQDLSLMVKERRFRPGVYHRLNVFPMALPARRERRGDIMTTGPILTSQATALLTPSPSAQGGSALVAGSASIRTLAEAERAHITATLNETNWIIGGPRGAASQLGLPRTTLISRMQRLGISGGASRGRPRLATQPLVRVLGGRSSRSKDDSSTGLRVLEAVAG